MMVLHCSKLTWVTNNRNFDAKNVADVIVDLIDAADAFVALVDIDCSRDVVVVAVDVVAVIVVSLMMEVAAVVVVVAHLTVLIVDCIADMETVADTLDCCKTAYCSRNCNMEDWHRP